VTEANTKFQFAMGNPLVQMGVQAGQPEAIKLMQTLSASVFRSMGDEASAALMSTIGPPPPAPPPPGQVPPPEEGQPPPPGPSVPPQQEAMPS
jgi:hypothetical protein